MKFRRSALGVSWIFVNLTVLVLAIGFIYANLLGQPAREFIPYLTIGLILWNYLTNSIVEGGNAFINSRGVHQADQPADLHLYLPGVRQHRAHGAHHAVRVRARGGRSIAVPVGPGTLLVVPGFMLMMMASLLLDHDLRPPEHAIPRRRAHGVGRHAGALLRDAGDFSGRAAAQAPHRCRCVIELNPMYHLLEVVRRPLLTAGPADWHSYAVTALFIVVLAAVAVERHRLLPAAHRVRAVDRSWPPFDLEHVDLEFRVGAERHDTLKSALRHDRTPRRTRRPDREGAAGRDAVDPVGRARRASSGTTAPGRARC